MLGNQARFQLQETVLGEEKLVVELSYDDLSY
jgi:hypothetical protein